MSRGAHEHTPLYFRTLGTHTFARFQQLCLSRPLRCWKHYCHPSPTVRTVDWGPHSLAHRSACVVAVTGLPPPPSLPRIHFAHEVGTPFACELRSERARPPRVPLAHILSYGRTTMSIYIADWSGMDMVVPTGRRRSSLARRRFHASTVRPAMRRRTAQTETPPTMRLMLFPCASLPEVASAPTTGTGGGGDGGGDGGGGGGDGGGGGRYRVGLP